MLFMVIEHVRGGHPRPVYQRCRALIRWAAVWLAIGVTAPALAAQSTMRVPCESLQYGFVDSTTWLRSRQSHDPRTAVSYALRDTTVLDASAIERITLWPHRLERDTVWDVVATLTPAAAGAFATATEAHIGQTIVVRIGRDVVETATVESRLGARLAIGTNVPRATADSLVTRSSRATAASCRFR